VQIQRSREEDCLISSRSVEEGRMSSQHRLVPHGKNAGEARFSSPMHHMDIIQRCVTPVDQEKPMCQPSHASLESRYIFRRVTATWEPYACRLPSTPLITEFGAMSVGRPRWSTGLARGGMGRVVGIRLVDNVLRFNKQ